MAENKNLLIVFVRNPELGKVKTRLASTIGDPAALNVYEYLLKHTFEVTSKLSCDKKVYYSEAIEQEDLWDDNYFGKHVQSGVDLGQRMSNAFDENFQEGYSTIVGIGSDLPDLKISVLEEAFSALQESNFVLGPAKDGGYYLIGMRKMNSAIFLGKKWSTETVLQETLRDLEKESVILLEERCDIDTADDLDAHPDLLRHIKNYD